MTLIFGINLSDRIFICGDTRMTQYRNGELLEIKDKIIKINYFTRLIIGAFARDAKMASYIINKLKKSIPQDLDIRSFSKRIEEYITPIANEYWEKYDSKAAVTVIFGGINPNKRREITPKNLYEKVKKFTELRGQGNFTLKPELMGSILKDFDKKTDRPEAADAYIFSVQIFPPNGFVITGAEWGEYLAYGPNGLSKDDIDPIIFGKIEFESNGSLQTDNVIISAILGNLVEKRKEETVSGTFFNAFISEKMQGAVPGRITKIKIGDNKEEFVSEIIRIGQTFYSKRVDGSLQRLTFIKDYKDFGNLDTV